MKHTKLINLKLNYDYVRRLGEWLETTPAKYAEATRANRDRWLLALISAGEPVGKVAEAAGLSEDDVADVIRDLELMTARTWTMKKTKTRTTWKTANGASIAVVCRTARIGPDRTVWQIKGRDASNREWFGGEHHPDDLDESTAGSRGDGGPRFDGIIGLLLELETKANHHGGPLFATVDDLPSLSAPPPSRSKKEQDPIVTDGQCWRCGSSDLEQATFQVSVSGGNVAEGPMVFDNGDRICTCKSCGWGLRVRPGGVAEGQTKTTDHRDENGLLGELQ